MKKQLLILLLLVSSISLSQTTLATKLKITGNSISTTAPFIPAMETDGIVNKINKSDLQDVIQVASAINLPVTGVAGKFYYTQDDKKYYTWNGTIYEPLSGGSSGGATGAATNLTTTPSATTVTIISDTGTDAIINLANGTNAGLFSAAEKTKLAGLNFPNFLAWDYENSSFWNPGTGGNPFNTSYGYSALGSSYYATGSDRNTAIGCYALVSNTTGPLNTAIGSYALYSNTTGSLNTAIGSNASQANTTGTYNTGIGSDALGSNANGWSNIAIGDSSGKYLANNMDNTKTNASIYIGNYTRSLNYNETNQIVIGHIAVGNGSNTVTIGNDAITKTYLKGLVLAPLSTNALITADATGKALVTKEYADANYSGGGSTSITSGAVTTALGYTPYNATNPSGFITASSLTPYLTTSTASSTYQPIGSYLAPNGSAAGLTSFPILNQNTTGTAATITGVISEGQVTNLVTDLSLKVDKVAGKSLVNDTDITKIATAVQPNVNTVFTSVNSNAIVALAYTGTNFTWTGTASNLMSITLTKDSVLANPTAPVTGAIYQFLVNQNASGLWALTYGTMFKFPDGVVPAINVNANSKGILTAIYDGTALLVVSVQNFL